MTTLHKQLRHSDSDISKNLHKSSNLTLFTVNSPSCIQNGPCIEKIESLIAKNRVYKELDCSVTSKENAQIWRILQKFALLPILFSFPFFLCWLPKLFCKSYNYLKCFTCAENWCCLIDYFLKIKRKCYFLLNFQIKHLQCVCQVPACLFCCCHGLIKYIIFIQNKCSNFSL